MTVDFWWDCSRFGIKGKKASKANLSICLRINMGRRMIEVKLSVHFLYKVCQKAVDLLKICTDFFNYQIDISMVLIGFVRFWSRVLSWITFFSFFHCKQAVSLCSCLWHLFGHISWVGCAPGIFLEWIKEIVFVFKAFQEPFVYALYECQIWYEDRYCLFCLWSYVSHSKRKKKGPYEK